MFTRRTVLNLLISCAVVSVADAAPAKKQHHHSGHDLLQIAGKLPAPPPDFARRDELVAV